MMKSPATTTAGACPPATITEVRSCKECGKPIQVQTGPGRKREFCNDGGKCRKAYQRGTELEKSNARLWKSTDDAPLARIELILQLRREREQRTGSTGTRFGEPVFEKGLSSSWQRRREEKIEEEKQALAIGGAS